MVGLQGLVSRLNSTSASRDETGNTRMLLFVGRVATDVFWSRSS